MEAEYIRSFNDKTRYRSLDPNNTYWAKDESRFGLKVSFFIVNCFLR